MGGDEKVCESFKYRRPSFEYRRPVISLSQFWGFVDYLRVKDIPYRLVQPTPDNPFLTVEARMDLTLDFIDL
ncbi:MAG: hypothetical protein C4521_07650 [Actinobacteria bacterium]|nr:MAG: hypothetical protein C4521_07650 [Actinomycetota bacterium]